MEARNEHIFAQLSSYTSHFHQSFSCHSGRPIKTHLSQIMTQLKDDTILRRNDSDAKLRMKLYTERKRNVKHNSIKEGEVVLLRNHDEESKQLLTYDPSPYHVVARKGSMITAVRDSRTVTHNSLFFKPINREKEKTSVQEWLCKKKKDRKKFIVN